MPDLTVAPEPPPASLAVQICLPSLPAEAARDTLGHIAEAFPEGAYVSSPDDLSGCIAAGHLRLLRSITSAASQSTLVPAAADYVNAWTAARDQSPRVILVLGPRAETVSAGTLQRLAGAVLEGKDLVVARYPVGTSDALVNSAILYPLTRALFSNPLRYPLPIDAALSPRMAEVLATAGQHLTASNRSSALIWPVAEAVFTRCTTCDTAGDKRSLPQLEDGELNDLFTVYVGSIFADAQAKAAFWQRAQLTGTSHPRHLANLARSAPGQREDADPRALIASFVQSYERFRELWSLVLPPNSMLGLNKLTKSKGHDFVLPEPLWARTVYDFLLAYRLQVVPRETLFPALTPIYRAWIASHIIRSGGDAATAEQLVEDGAHAFERDKPYLIARWRWPDRFNP